MAPPTHVDADAPMELSDEGQCGPPSVALPPVAWPPSWAILDVDASTPASEVDGFLHRFRPSHCTRDQVAWICVNRSDHTLQEEEQNDPNTMVHEWQWLCRHGDASAEGLDRLARVYNVLSGKWMVFCPTAQVDVVWQRIARATTSGLLGPSAKVSPADRGGGSVDHVVCVYAANYLDRETVQRLRDGLRQLGHNETLLFKPDVYTYCGVYKDNEWGLPTYLFSE